MKDWRKVEKMFGALLELEPAERPAYLDQICGEDEALRQELGSLLAANDEISTTFLANPPGGREVLMPPAPLQGGDTVGSYRLLEKIGEGGMGTVFLGERADGTFDRQVAVKFLRHGMETELSMQRFDLERRILANLDHPGIARLLDGGTTEPGAPYVVMEWIDGEPIDRHCERHQLSSLERVDLFLEVAEAVAAAHRNLVVHRDIKPSNVLVDGRGKAKLLDFGIAKILDERWQDDQGDLTESWNRLLTPNYASPEQIRGERVTMATDVYLLGILLYKLLAGQLPHRFSGRTLLEVEAILTSERPKPPSRILGDLTREREAEKTAPKGVKRIDTDLDYIVLKALRTEPPERYGSVVEMAEDLRRFRQGEPIRARIGSRRYRLKKFTQRHWQGLTVAALAFAFLAVFAVDRTIQVERRDRALAQTEASVARFEGLWDFVDDLFWQADPAAAKGEQLRVSEAILRGERKLANGQGGPPDVAALVHGLFGRIRFGLGEYEASLASLEAAQEIFASLPEKDDALRAAEWRAWGDHSLATLYQLETLQDEDAAKAIEESIASARRAYEEAQSLKETDPRLTLELSNPLVGILCITEQWQEAAELTQEMMGLVARLEDSTSAPVAQAMARRALILKNVENDLESAQDLYSQALDIYLDLEGPVHPEVANLHNQLALVAFDLGDATGSLAAHQEALRVRKALYPTGHWEIYQSHAHLSDVFHAKGDLQQAIRHMEAAVEVSEVVRGETSRWAVDYALRLSQLLVEHGQHVEAESLLRFQLSSERRAVRPEGSRLIVRGEGILGVVLMAQGKDGGERLLLRSLEILRGNPSGYEDAISWLESFLPEKSSAS